MEIQIEVSDEEGNRREYVGMEVCHGPGIMRVLLTRPFGMAGQTVDLPLERVESVTAVESGVLGDPVRPIDEEEESNDRDPSRT